MSFKIIFRLIFVLFSLYLMGDAFSRWDGFSYYASFSEFMPGIALAFILWNIVAVMTAAICWLIFILIQWLGNQIKLKINLSHLLLHAFIFLVLGVFAWKIKKILWPDIQTTLPLKITVLSCVTFVSIYLTWLFRNRAGRWIVIVHERITPLVWLFSALLLISIPVVTYHTWFKNVDSVAINKILDHSDTLKSRPNIILLTFDALAARHMSVYGYERNTTPFIKKWGKRATIFTRAEASSNFTTPAVAGLMTGKRVWTHQTYHIAGTKPLHGNIESLPALLKKDGYFNMAFVANPFASASVLGMSGSFDIAPPASEFGSSDSLFGWKFGIVDKMLYRTFGEKIRLHNWILRNDFILSRIINLVSRNIRQTPVPPKKAFDMFLNNLDAGIPKPFFAWIHIFPPHDPYLPPLQFREQFNASRKMRTYKKQERLIEESYKYLFQFRPLPEEMQTSVDLMKDYYDEFITYVDKEFEGFVAALNKREIENTVIILSADHGESFRHGYFTHGGPFLYEDVTNIPLVIKESGQEKGGVVDSLVEQIDIPATILDWAEISIPHWMEGRSLIPVMRGETIESRSAFSMNFEGNRSRGHQITSGSISVWDGDYKLIHYLEGKESLLFNVKRDAGEKDNIINKEPETARRLLDVLLTNLEQANQIISEGKSLTGGKVPSENITLE